MARLIDPDKLFRAIRDDAEISGKTYARVKEHIFNAEDEVVRCKDCKHRYDHMVCPKCFEEQVEWDDDGYFEVDWIVHDRTLDEGFCDRGERITDERKAD